MPGTRFFTAPSMTDQPAGTSISCSFPLCSTYLIFGMDAPSDARSDNLSGDVFHGNGRVRKLFGRDDFAFRDQLAADEIFGRRIDGFDRRHAALAQVEDGKL